MTARLAAVLAVSLAICSCERETRRYNERPAGSPPAEGVRQTPLQPGRPDGAADAPSPYQGNAWGISEGKQLFTQMNCTGCHARGGGAIGPALMDDKWIYGARPAQIYSTIVEGRPNGMPAYGGRLPDQQVWQIVAYIESLGVQVPRDAAPGRDDDMSVNKPELRRERLEPRQTGHR